MMIKVLIGEEFSKTDHRRALMPKLNHRTDSSIDYKHRNISAVLVQAGERYVPGYRPAWNYQALLKDVVLGWLEKSESELVTLEDAEMKIIHESQIPPDLASLFVTPPDRTEMAGVRESRVRTPRHTNFAEREAKNRDLGERGEAFVFEVERQRLASIGRADLVNDVEWTSKEKGDGAGYDIRSFSGQGDNELFIEVKTTNSGKFQPFLISANEVAFSAECAESYSLYRLFEFSHKPALYELRGAVDSYVHLSPSLYRASFS